MSGIAPLPLESVSGIAPFGVCSAKAELRPGVMLLSDPSVFRDVPRTVK